MKKIGVLTSGGDAPGMNAAIRAVVAQANYYGLEVAASKYGYRGIIDKDFRPLTTSNTVHKEMRRSGTFIYSARFEDFAKEEVQLQAIKNLEEEGVEALVVIGGDGSFRGAEALTRHGFPAIGIPGTIDNDIPGTDYTIGFDTCMNNILEEIDKIADTAASHNRTFVIEVMGRGAGDLALWSGLASGVDAILVPEVAYNMRNIVRRVHHGRNIGKDHSLIILAEGVMSADQFIKEYNAVAPKEKIRGVTLGHIQRGGTPTIRDRVLATTLGAKAVDLLLQGQKGVYLGIKDDKITTNDITTKLSEPRRFKRPDLYELNTTLTISSVD